MTHYVYFMVDCKPNSPVKEKERNLKPRSSSLTLLAGELSYLDQFFWTKFSFLLFVQ